MDTPTVEVVVGGKTVRRAIDYMEPNKTGFLEAVPVLKDDEQYVRTVTGEIHIIKGMY